MAENAIQWLVILIIFGVLVWFFTSRRKPGTAGMEIVIGLLREIDHNIKVIEIRREVPDGYKNFRMSYFNRNSSKLEFLQAELVERINKMYVTLTDYSNMIDTARKNKSSAELHTLDLDNLKKVVDQNRADLIEWLRVDYEAGKTK